MPVISTLDEEELGLEMMSCAATMARIHTDSSPSAFTVTVEVDFDLEAKIEGLRRPRVTGLAGAGVSSGARGETPV